MSKCRPHHWRKPKVGDHALACSVCGRELDMVHHITTNISASIVNAISSRLGPAAAADFRSAFSAAQANASARWGVERWSDPRDAIMPTYPEDVGAQ